MLTQCEVDHGGDGETTFGGQAHGDDSFKLKPRDTSMAMHEPERPYGRVSTHVSIR
jgi:hypothetical protein